MSVRARFIVGRRVVPDFRVDWNLLSRSVGTLEREHQGNALAQLQCVFDRRKTPVDLARSEPDRFAGGKRQVCYVAEFSAVRAVWCFEGDAGRELAANRDERRGLAAPQYHVDVGRARGRGGPYPWLVDDEKRSRRCRCCYRQYAREGEEPREGAGETSD